MPTNKFQQYRFWSKLEGKKGTKNSEGFRPTHHHNLGCVTYSLQVHNLGCVTLLITHRRCHTLWTAATWVLGNFACSIFLIDSPSSGVDVIRRLLTASYALSFFSILCDWGHPSLLLVTQATTYACCVYSSPQSILSYY